jgi:hypothetical protein
VRQIARRSWWHDRLLACCDCTSAQELCSHSHLRGGHRRRVCPAGFIINAARTACTCAGLRQDIFRLSSSIKDFASDTTTFGYDSGTPLPVGKNCTAPSCP